MEKHVHVIVHEQIVKSWVGRADVSQETVDRVLKRIQFVKQTSPDTLVEVKDSVTSDSALA